MQELPFGTFGNIDFLTIITPHVHKKGSVEVFRVCVPAFNVLVFKNTGNEILEVEILNQVHKVCQKQKRSFQ
jgi:hypothetical protein